MDYNIAICMPRLDDQVQRDIISALVNYTINNEKYKGFHFHILTTYSDLKFENESADGESAIFTLIGKISVDALLIFPERFYIEEKLNNVIKAAEDRGIPMIAVGKILPGIDSITYGKETCMKNIVSHIIEHHGCRYINFLAGQKVMEATDERLKAFKETMLAHGLPIEEERIGFGEFWDYPTECVMERFYKSKLPFPQAIICANDVMAITVISSLREHGYRVPDDVLVTGFDGIDMERFHTPRLTTAELDYKTLALTIFDYIEKKINGVTLPPETTVDFIQRFSESCGCVCEDTENRYQPFASLWKEVSCDIGFNDAVIKLSSSLKLGGTLYDMFSSIVDFFNTVYTTQIRVCVCADYIENVSSDESYSGTSFSDIMYSVIEKCGDYNSFACDGKSFPTSEIMADRLDSSERNNHTIIYPLHYNEIVYGYICANTEPNHIALYQIRALSMNLAFVLERIATFRHMEAINDRLEQTYIYDSMTGLLSRNGYYRIAKQQIDPFMNSDKRIVILSVDLDNLKDINDNYGHNCGDTAIKLIASTLKEYVGEEGISARFGGDEFIGIRLFDREPDAFVQKFFEGFENSIAEKVKEMNLEYHVSASFGIVSTMIRTLPSLEEGIKSADVLMYAQKKAKKRGSRSFPY